MSKNVNVNGVDYTGVSQVQLKTTSGGTALFKDVDEITTPSGSLNITANGTHDVTNYAQAVVNVSGDSSGEDWEAVAKMLLSYNDAGITENIYTTVPDGITVLRECAFSGLYADNGNQTHFVTLPDSIEVLKGKCFYYNSKVQIGTLPTNLKKIGSQNFAYAKKCFTGTELEIPASVETIESLAFYQYNGEVNTLTFKGTPTTIANNAFQTNTITTINVPWAEGAVANAPWGATSATINYNYTGA